MNQNENKSMGLTDTDDLEHIREIEKMLDSRTDETAGKTTPVRRYVRKRPGVGGTPQKPESPAAEASTIIMNRVDAQKPSEASSKTAFSKPSNDIDADVKRVPTQKSPVKKAEPAKEQAKQTPASPKKPASVTPKQGNEIVSSRHPAVQKQKAKKAPDTEPKEEYTPLLTENDDFELDDNPEPDNIPGGAVTALTSVAKAVIYLVAVLAVSITLAVSFISIANDVFAFVKDEEPVTVVVPENCDTETLAEILAESGAIKYPKIFNMYIKFKEKEGDYVPGTYSVSPMLNYDYMIYEFKEKAPARTTVVVTIPEGYSTDQIVDLLVSKGLGTYDGYVRAINEYEFDYKFLENADSFSPDRYWKLDGYLYPDTYYYYSDSTEETVIYKMLENFNNKFTEEYYTRAEELGMSVDKLITLASMIQKEVRYADEFGNVSSVFHNRLKNPAYYPHLDSDATIVYAIEHDTGERPETLTDTSYDSPYNTYKCIGLPPGPIANPSIEAIRYAMYPSETKYYYFVSGPDGRTVFSRTYAEHQQAIADLY
ncbi:MAG: endolytic transglycosylase MltG [Clostridia bacterium]|nr:endolytic transglycosylase MltG [Clostridia bacterium]